MEGPVTQRLARRGRASVPAKHKDLGLNLKWRKRHWKTEVVVASLEMLSGRRRRAAGQRRDRRKRLEATVAM